MSVPVEQQWKKHRRRQWAAWVFADLPLAILMALVLSVVLLVVTLKGRLIEIPDRYVQQLNAPLADVVDGYDLAFTKASFGLGSSLHPRIVLRNVTVRTDDQEDVVDLAQLDLSIDGWGLTQGRVKPVSIALDGTVVQLNRDRSGQFNLAFAASDGQDFQSLGDVFSWVEDLFVRPDLERLETLSLNGLTVRYDDRKSRNMWTFDGGRFLANRDIDTQDLRLRADLALLTGRSQPATLALSYRRQGTQDAVLTADMDGVRATDLAEQAPALAWLALVDAPISGTVRTRLTNDGDAPLFASLDFGQGTILPEAEKQSFAFSRAKTYFSYAPRNNRIDIETLDISSDWGSFRGQGYALLQGNQFVVSAQSNSMRIAARSGMRNSVPVRQAGIDLRLTTNPVRIEIPQAFFEIDDTMVRLKGNIGQAPDGWAQSFDASLNQADVPSLLNYWPETAGAKFRQWVDENVEAGTLTDVSMGIRRQSGAAPQTYATFSYSDAKLRFMRDMPLLENGAGYGAVTNNTVDLKLAQGVVPFAGFGLINIGGSAMQIPDMSIKPALARLDLNLAGPAPAVFAALDRKPMEIFKKSGRSPDLGSGQARAELALVTPIKKGVQPTEIVYQVDGSLRNFASDVLVPNQSLTSSVLNVAANPSGVVVSGPVKIGNVPADIRWTQRIGAPTSELKADITLDAAALRQFNIALPPNTLSGSAPAQLDLQLARGTPPKFKLASDLRGMGLSIPAIGWSKARNSRGDFSISGSLSETPDIDGFALSAPGLSAAGNLDLSNGRLAQASITSLKVGNWLSGAVNLRDRGRGRPMAISLDSARLDIRSAPFAQGGNGTAGLPPLSGTLQSLTIANGLRLTGVRFDLLNGSGRFSGRLNGGTPINGQLSRRNGQTVIDIVSDDAAGVLRDLELMPRGTGGTLKMTLASRASGGWRGTAEVLNTRVKDAPVIAEILSAVSVIGILEQLDGKGLVMSEIRAEFGLKDDLFTLYSSSAVGPSLGLSLDGYINTKTQQLDLQGVVSPLYLVNAIGAIFTRRGEGLIGFNFTLKGPANDVSVGVNPLSAFTPGLFREIFRRPAPEIVE